MGNAGKSTLLLRTVFINVIHCSSILIGVVILIPCMFKRFLRCYIARKYHCVTFLYSKPSDFLVTKQFFQQLAANSPATPLGINNDFHNEYCMFALTKSNNGKRYVAFTNNLAPKILPNNKSIFICPIFIKSSKAFVQTCGINSTFIQPVFNEVHCFGIIIIPNIIHSTYAPFWSATEIL